MALFLGNLAKDSMIERKFRLYTERGKVGGGMKDWD